MKEGEGLSSSPSVDHGTPVDCLKSKDEKEGASTRNVNTGTTQSNTTLHSCNTQCDTEEVIRSFPELSERRHPGPGVVRVPGVTIGVPLYASTFQEIEQRADASTFQETEQHADANASSAIDSEPVPLTVDAEFFHEIPWYRQRRTAITAVVLIAAAGALIILGIITSHSSTENAVYTTPSLSSRLSYIPSVAPLSTTVHPTSYVDVQHSSLKKFYIETGGSSWTSSAGWNYNAQYSICNWWGISCNANLDIQKISLPSNNLHGDIASISEILLEIDSLRVIELQNNYLFGDADIATDILARSLLHLEYVDLRQNQIAGEVSSALCEATETLLFDCSIECSCCDHEGRCECVDESSDWSISDEHGYECEWFQQDPTRCENQNDVTDGFQQSALTACCACGGGMHYNLFPSTKPSAVPTIHLSISPTMMPSRSFPPSVSISPTITVMDQREILAHFYISANGDSWLKNFHWLQPLDHECDWYGIRCDMFGQVSGIVLSGNALSGSIDSCISLLSNLKKLELMSNDFTSSIPSEIGMLQTLEILNLSRNYDLTSTIPTELSNLASLQSLDLSYTDLTGPIPREIGNISTMALMHISHTMISSSIPAELGMLQRLEYLFLNANYLSGTIPTELGKDASLKFLSIGDNIISGTLPSEIGSFESLKHFDAPYNYLSGVLPTEIGNMGGRSSLRSFQVGHNNLVGTIPTEMGSLASLTTLNLAYNQLSGNLPTEQGRMQALEYIILHANNLNGPIPSELGLLEALDTIITNYNDFTGILPTELGQLHSLRSLFLGRHIGGTLPSELGICKSLQYIWLNGNSISGTIPTEFGLLKSPMMRLWLDANSLTGTIPSELGLNASLLSLHLSKNSLTGSLPSELGMLKSLEKIQVNENYLTSTVPSQLGDAMALISLRVDNNDLTGSLPNELCLLSDGFLLKDMSADCEEIHCPCCSHCCIDDVECAVV